MEHGRGQASGVSPRYVVDHRQWHSHYSVVDTECGNRVVARFDVMRGRNPRPPPPSAFYLAAQFSAHEVAVALNHGGWRAERARREHGIPGGGDEGVLGEHVEAGEEVLDP